MSTQPGKLFIFAGLLLGILMCALGCLGAKITGDATDKISGQLPRRKVDITIETSQQQAFFDQLREFADKHDFEILIDSQPSGAQDFLIYMTRDDIIISGANPFVPGEYKLGFYDADRQHPAPESAFDDLIDDLESFVSEVPGTTFSVEK
jgi:hypothetical protein